MKREEEMCWQVPHLSHVLFLKEVLLLDIVRHGLQLKRVCDVLSVRLQCISLPPSLSFYVFASQSQ